MTLMNKWYIRRDFSVAAAKKPNNDIDLSYHTQTADEYFMEM